MAKKELSKMEQKYLVAKTESRDKTIAHLKSNLFSMTLDEFIIKAIDQFSDEVKQTKCHYCQQDNVVTTKKGKETRTQIAGKEYTIQIKNYPRNTCKLCDNTFENAKVSYYLSELIDYEIHDLLRNRKPIPEELDFNELIKIHRSN